MKKDKEILKQDIVDLGYLIDKYTKEGQFHKASECLTEMREIQEKLKGKKDAPMAL